MPNVQCRLCSSTTALISLFSGKCRQNRDYIRKLIDVTTGIKFQKNDIYKCICYACTIQIYNFYIFMTRSHENEKQLQATSKDNGKIKCHKIEVTDLADIDLPNIEELEETLMPWFISKQKYCGLEGTDMVKNNESIVEANNHSSIDNLRDHKLIESGTQYDVIEHTERGTQYELYSTEASTQTYQFVTKSKKIQCKLELKSCNENEDAVPPVTEKNTVCHVVKKLNKLSQFELGNGELYSGKGTLNNEKDKSRSQICMERNDSQLLDKFDKETQCDLYAFKKQVKADRYESKAERTKLTKTKQKSSMCTAKSYIDHSFEGKFNNKGEDELFSIDVNTQTKELISIKPVKIQCELLKINQQIRENTSFPRNIKQKNLDENIHAHETTKPFTNSVESYSRLPKRYQEISKNKSKESFTQTDVQYRQDMCVESYSKETQCDLYIAHKFTKKTEIPSVTRTQGRLLRKSSGKPKDTYVECATQTEISCCQKQIAGGLYSNDYNKADILNLDIKQENQSPLSLSPVKCLNINIDSAKSETLISPSLSCISPKSSSLLAIKDKIEHVIVCPQCDKTIYSNSEYKLHKKSHMQCNFCKKKFTTIKKTKFHIQYECNIQKMRETVPVVTLIRLECLMDIRKKYPECLELLRDIRESLYSKESNNSKNVLRIRSRSVSDTNSVINCTTCRSSISVLTGVSIGVDKSVQVNFIFDTDLITSLGVISRNSCLKRDLETSVTNDHKPAKKIKTFPIITR